jgi:hypothetical protein
MRQTAWQLPCADANCNKTQTLSFTLAWNILNKQKPVFLWFGMFMLTLVILSKH